MNVLKHAQANELRVCDDGGLGMTSTADGHGLGLGVCLRLPLKPEPATRIPG